MDIVGKTIQNGEPTPEHPVDIENKINLTGAIQILNKLKSKVTLVKVDDENNSEKEYRLPFLMNIEQQAIETVLSELEKKDTEIIEAKEANRQLSLELEKKEAIINEMAKHIHLSGDYECLNKECEDDGDISCEDCIKEYFYKKVKETKDNDIQFFKNTKITKYCRRKLNRRSARNSKRNSF